MAFRNHALTYQFEVNEKVAMIMVLDQFSEAYTTIDQIKNRLTVSGSVVLDTQEAVILARLMYPHYPHFSEKLLAHPGMERYPAHTQSQIDARRFQLIERLK